MPHAKFKPNPGKSLEIAVAQEKYVRLPIKTSIVTEKDNLLELLQKYVAPHLEPGDFLFISEKVLALTQGRITKIRDVKPSRLARFLARKVDNRYGTEEFRGFGHGTPVAMQLFINEAGYLRVIFAAAIAALTKPLGIRGAFYFISGKRAKSVDCPMSFLIQPYTQYAKLPPLNPGDVAKELAQKLGVEIVVVDANYLGAFSMGKSSKKLSEKFIQEVFRDNPLGQSDELTPFCIVRRTG